MCCNGDWKLVGQVNGLNLADDIKMRIKIAKKQKVIIKIRNKMTLDVFQGIGHVADPLLV